jgi:hypothetical protein
MKTLFFRKFVLCFFEALTFCEIIGKKSNFFRRLPSSYVSGKMIVKNENTTLIKEILETLQKVGSSSVLPIWKAETLSEVLRKFQTPRSSGAAVTAM